jgi:hypothetical protein
MYHLYWRPCSSKEYPVGRKLVVCGWSIPDKDGVPVWYPKKWAGKEVMVVATMTRVMFQENTLQEVAHSDVSSVDHIRVQDMQGNQRWFVSRHLVIPMER